MCVQSVAQTWCAKLCSHREYGRLHKYYIRHVTVNRQRGRDGWTCYLHSTTAQLKQNEGQSCQKHCTKLHLFLMRRSFKTNKWPQSYMKEVLLCRYTYRIILIDSKVEIDVSEIYNLAEVLSWTSRSPSWLIITGRNPGVLSPLTRGYFFCFKGRKSLCLTPLH